MFIVGGGLVVAGGFPTARRLLRVPVAEEPGANDGHRLLLPMLTREGLPPSLDLSTERVYQGGALRIRAENATAGSIRFLGRELQLAAGEPLEGFFGVGTEDRVGPAPLSADLTTLDGTPATFERVVTVLKTAWTVDYITLTPEVGELLDPEIVAREERRLTAIYAGVTERQWAGAWVLPVDAPVSGYFGEQRSFNGGPVGGHHGGTDFGAEAGQPVHATNSGTVVLAERLDVRGNMVIVDHGAGVFSGYGHQEALAVAAGQTVTTNQLLGYVGTTGLSTGPHLHWEMAVAGVLVDGLRWVDGSQGF